MFIHFVCVHMHRVYDSVRARCASFMHMRVERKEESWQPKKLCAQNELTQILELAQFWCIMFSDASILLIDAFASFTLYTFLSENLTLIKFRYDPTANPQNSQPNVNNK